MLLLESNINSKICEKQDEMRTGLQPMK